MDVNSEPKIQLTTLLESSGFRLAYALPLLLSSIVITFAGTFLTLDRTRVFPSTETQQDSYPYMFDEVNSKVKKKGKKTKGREASCWSSWSYRLDGGVGGLLAGYVFGLHAATFLSLYIPNTSSSSPLSSAAFLVVWLLTVIPSTLFGGRWRLAALFCIGTTGGLCLSLGLLIIMHPNLRTRVVFTSVLVPLIIALTLVPYMPFLRLRHLVHVATRLSMSAAGAFSVTFAVAVLAREHGSPSWANVYDRLWVANGSGWGKSSEHGFAALFCVLWVLGAGSDWALRRKLGDSIDEIWESYLSEYATGLPNERNRAGFYQPRKSLWHRVLVFLRIRKRNSPSARPRDIIFPSDAELGFPKPFANDTDTRYASLPMIENGPRDSTFDISPFVPPPPRPVTGFFDMVKGLPKAYTGGGKIMHNGGHDTAGETTEMGVLNLPRRKKTLHRPHRPRAGFSRDFERQGSVAKRKQRAPLQFRPNSTYSDSDSDSDSELDALKTPLNSPQRPRLHVTNFASANASGTSLSGTTVQVDGSDDVQTPIRSVEDSRGSSGSGPERARIHDLRDAFGLSPPPPIHDYNSTPLDYSDVEVEEADVTSALRQERAPSSHPTLRRQSTKRARGRDLLPPGRPLGAVPMTPSLVNALRRIAVAQQEAFGPITTGTAAVGEATSPQHEHIAGLPITATHARVAPSLNLPTPPFSSASSSGVGNSVSGPSVEPLRQVEIDVNDEGGLAKWDEFWREVSAKAEEAAYADLRRGETRRAERGLGLGRVASPVRS